MNRAIDPVFKALFQEHEDCGRQATFLVCG
jgi:hypothetical protein